MTMTMKSMNTNTIMTMSIITMTMTTTAAAAHDHEGHHHADDVFESVGIETPKKFTKEKIEKALKALEDKDEYGFILRAKGIVEAEDGQWIHFDYAPG